MSRPTDWCLFSHIQLIWESSFQCTPENDASYKNTDTDFYYTQITKLNSLNSYFANLNMYLPIEDLLTVAVALVTPLFAKQLLKDSENEEKCFLFWEGRKDSRYYANRKHSAYSKDNAGMGSGPKSVTVLEWPSQSPELNPTQHLYRDLKMAAHSVSLPVWRSFRGSVRKNGIKVWEAWWDLLL